MRNQILLIILFSAIFQGIDAGNNPDSFKTNAPLLKKFQDMKFGMFVHWGPVSLKGTEIGWSRGKEVPVEEYDQLYKQFNPTLFNADEWISILKDTGMKYFVFTTHHHDGFSNWFTDYSDYDMDMAFISVNEINENIFRPRVFLYMPEHLMTDVF